MAKRLLGSLTVAAAFLIVLAFPVWAADLAHFILAQENEYLRLYVQPEQAEFAVEDKNSGEVWFSAPQNLSLERFKRGNARNAMRSLLILNYFTPKREGKSLNSYVDSVLNEEFTVTITPAEVRFDFTLGKQWSESSYYPIFIAKDKFEALLEQVEDTFDRSILLDSYNLLSFEKQAADPYERVVVFGLDVKEYFGSYEPKLLAGNLLDKKLGMRNEPHERVKYYLERLADTMVTFRADVERRGLLTAEDFDFVFEGPFYALLDETYPIYNRPEFFRIFSELGYTPADVAADHRRHSLDAPRPNPQVFKISVLLRLDGQSLLVTVPAAEISYPINIPDEQGVLETFYPYSIDLLPYFGAAHQNSSGYIFVPERSGGLIQISNPKKNGLPAYSGSVYGTDRSITPRIEKVGQGSQIYLPVFGLKEENKAFFTVLEEGAALGQIQAASGGRNESFAKVYARYALTPRATITLYGVESSLDDKAVDAYAVLPYQDQITQRITFLSGAEADYVGMANWYRNYLVTKFGLEKIDSSSPTPLNLEIIGGFHDVEPFLGVPKEVIKPMTTYGQTLAVLKSLKAREPSEIRLRYLGWSRGGIEHVYPKRLALEKALGGPAEFDELLNYARENGIKLYLDQDLNAVYRNSLFNGFRVGRDAARFLNRNAVKLWDYNLATFQRIPNRQAFVVSPRVLDGLVDDFLARLAPYNASALSLRRLGSEVYSDFIDDKEKTVNRQRALAIAQRQLEKLRDSGYSLLIPGAIDAAIPYAEQIVEAPPPHSPLLIIDENIPFYQMVLHGYVDFSGEPHNVGGISPEKMLRWLETGELPYFRCSFADPSLIKGTFFEHLLTGTCEDLLAVDLKFFAEAAPLLQKIRGRPIIHHRQLAPGVYKTLYENGIGVVVNYNEEDFRWADKLVGGHGYVVSERSVTR